MTPSNVTAAAGVALHRVQWSQAFFGRDAGAAGPVSGVEAPCGPLWQMTEKGSKAALAAGGAVNADRIVVRAIR